MAKFELSINTDNAAFDDDYVNQLDACFESILDQIRAEDYLNGKHSNVRDTNGNVIGTFKVTND